MISVAEMAEAELPGSRWTPLLMLSAMIAALGGLLFGLDTAVISGTTAGLKTTFHLTPAMLGFTVSSALIGTIAGTLLAGYGSERLGRRACLRMAALSFLVSALGCALSPQWSVLLAFRIVGGLGIGAASVLAPMYIAEIAPPDRRGRMVAMFQVNIVLGILLAYLSNALVEMRGLGAAEWRWELGVTAIPAGLFLAAVSFIPESPRWLLKRGRYQEALAVLDRIGDARPVQQIARTKAMQAEETQFAARGRLFNSGHGRAILVAMAMGVFCQFSGINAVLYFLNDIFAGAGLSSVSGSLRGVAIGATNLIFTLLAMAFIDRFGRKFLLTIGSVAMAFTLSMIGYCFGSATHADWLLWLLIAYCGAFSFSEGAVMWVYISELFPSDVREKGQALGGNAHWVANAVISTAFPVMLAYSRSLPFYFFAFMMVLQLVLVVAIFPETKGRSLEWDAR